MKILPAFCSFAVKLFCICVTTTLLALAGVVLWVHTGARSLDMFTPYIEYAMQPADGNAVVHIAHSTLLWESWAKPITVHASDVSVRNRKGELIASVPETEVSFYVYKLLFGKLRLKAIEIIRPQVVLQQSDDGSLSLGFDSGQGSSNSLNDALALMTADEGDEPLTHLQSFSIRHATLAVKNGKSGIFLRSPDASLEVRRVSGGLKAKLTMPVTFDSAQARIEGDFRLDKLAKTMQGDVSYDAIPSAVIYALIPAQDWLAGVHLPLSGKAKITSDYTGNLSRVDFTASAGAGTLSFPDEFSETLQLHQIKLEGSLSDHFDTLELHDLAIDFNPLHFAFSGTVRKVDGNYGITGEAKMGGGQVADVGRYWPLSLSPHTRSWVVSHISGGSIPHAEVSLDFKPGDFKLKNAPDKDITATMAVKNTTVNYLPTHPPVTAVNGTVHFTGNTMDAHITGARYMTGTQVSAAQIRLPDLAAADVRLFLNMDLKAPASDVVTFLSLPDLNKARRLNLTPAITGNVEGNVKLDFIAFSEDDSKTDSGHINYAIEGKLDNVSQNDFLGKRDISSAEMKLHLNNKGVNVAGKAGVNGIPMQIDLSSSFGKDAATRYAVRCNMPASRLPDFGLRAMDFLSGTLGVDAVFNTGSGQDTTKAALDLTDAQIRLPEHNFIKPKGQRVSLDVTTRDLPGGNTSIPSFTLRGSGLSASGRAELDASTHDFKTLDFDDLHINADALDELHYERLSNGLKLVARGNMFDVSPYVSKRGNMNGSFSYDVDVKVRQLLLGPNRALIDADVQAQCAAHCDFAHIAANLPNGTDFHYDISGGKLVASSTDAGELARVLGLLEGMNGGVMSLTGVYDGGVLSGAMHVKDYTLNGTPVLSRILTIASLTGLMDTVRGSGIRFKRLDAPYIYHNNVVTLREAKTHGPALGITADGTVDVRENKVDLKGALVPSYTLNSLIGNVPVIGNMLIGGSGKGLIALTYSVSGDMKDPNIMINPLSVLTPGFMRNIFTVFDKPAPDMAKLMQAEKNKEEAGQQQAAPVAPQTDAPALPSLDELKR